MTKELAEKWVAELQKQIDNNEMPLIIAWPWFFPPFKKKTLEEHNEARRMCIRFLTKNYIEERG